MRHEQNNTIFSWYTELGRHAVLVSETEPALRFSLRSALEAAQMDTVAVGTAEATKTAAEEAELWAIILECHYPEEEPGHLIASLRTLSPTLPLICTTATKYRSHAFEAGASVVISKPYALPYVVQCTAAAVYRQREAFWSTLI